MGTTVIVIGGGSAGVGAAYRAALCGAEVWLIETGGVLGGTSVLAGVNCWEPGIASFGLNRILYERLRRIPLAASVGRTIHPYDPESHIGLNGVDPALPYKASLRRGTLGAAKTARVHFEPAAMARVMRETLLEAGVRPVTNTAFIGARADGERVRAALLRDLQTGEEYALSGDVFIDCTGDAVVCRSLEVPACFGEDAQALYGEPCAPERATDIVNGVSLCFRAAPGPVPDELPRWTLDTEAAAWISECDLPASHVTLYPNGDRCYNELPLMEGSEYFRTAPRERMRALTARVWLYWDRMKREHGHGDWHITQIFPRAGVRESWRVRTLEMTTENDLRRGFPAQGDGIVALADHTLDTHGRRTTHAALPSALETPWGVRGRSLVTAQYENLLVCGRCAGFSHLAASACRLSRTMLDLGEAAGALAVETGDLRTCSMRGTRERLDFERYLAWAETEYPRIGT